MPSLPGKIKSDNHLVYCLLTELPTECPSKPNGCSWKGERIRLASHLSECPYVIVECIFGCGRTIIRNELYRHTSECPRNSFLCKYCLKTFAAGDLRSHQEKCKAETRPCPFHIWGCGWQGHMTELIMHLDRCEEKHQQFVKNRDSKEVDKEPVLERQTQDIEVIAKVPEPKVEAEADAEAEPNGRKEDEKSHSVRSWIVSAKEKAKLRNGKKGRGADKFAGKCPAEYRMQRTKMVKFATRSKYGG